LTAGAGRDYPPCGTGFGAAGKQLRLMYMFCKHIGAGHSAGYLRVYCTLPALVSVPGSKEQDLTLTAPWPKYPDAYCVCRCALSSAARCFMPRLGM